MPVFIHVSESFASTWITIVRVQKGKQNVAGISCRYVRTGTMCTPVPRVCTRSMQYAEEESEVFHADKLMKKSEK